MISSRQFAEWMAYHRLEPFGQDIDHAMQAQTTTLLANVYRDRKRRSAEYKLEDFVPGERDEEDQEAAHQASLRGRIDTFMMSVVAAEQARQKRKTPTLTRPKQKEASRG